MTNRRQFLRDIAAQAGVLFTACNLAQSAAHAQSAKPEHRKVTVGGRRAKTIDMHAHVMIPEATAMLGLKADPTGTVAQFDDRFARMDEWGFDMQVLSINANWYGADQSVAARLIALQNEKLAGLCSQYPDRFAAFASVALQFPEMAAEQLEEGVKKYKLKGAAIGGHVNGDELSNPKFDPFWKKAEELGCVVFMHPQGIPEMAKRFAGNGGLTNVIGNPLETTIFLSHLIYDGTLDKFPGLKICSSHGGGYLPSYAARSDYGCVRFPETCKTIKKHPTEYLRQLYFDSMVFTSEGLRHLIAETGVSQIVLGTDYPYPWSTTTVDHILKTPGLSDADKRAILSGNAAKLLGIAV